MAEPPPTKKKSTTTTTSVAVNRSLNDLPDHILLHILSSFPTTLDAIETRFLSRKWRYLWLSTPSFNFSCLRFSRTNRPNPSTIQSFVDFVERTLIRRPPNSTFLSFKVQFNFTDLKFASHVNSWIRFSVSRNVETLDLNLFNYQRCLNNVEKYDDVRFGFPFYLLRDSSCKVRVLKLGGCNLSLQPALSFSEKTRFFSLRSLSLQQVVMTDQMVVDLMVACANVEALALSRIRGCKHFKIRSSKLKELTLEFFKCDQGSVEMATPNLLVVRINHFDVGKYVLRDGYSLVEAHVNVEFYKYWVMIIRLVRHVKHLSSNNMWLELLNSRDIYSESFILYNLKYVELRMFCTESDMMGLAVLLSLSPIIQTIVLVNCSALCPETYEEGISEDFIKQLSFNLPSLRHVKMKSFMGTECEKFLLLVLLKRAVILESIVLIPAEVGGGTPIPPVVIDLQFNGQDFEYIINQL